MRIVLIFGFTLVLASCEAPPENASNSPIYTVDSLPLIPQPNEIISAEGTFSMPSKIRIAFSANCNDETRWLTNQLKNLGFEVNPVEKQSAEITLQCDSAGFFLGKPQYEAYALEITPEGISLRATYATGLFRGMQTLMQLLETHSENSKTVVLPAMQITDKPLFVHRGMLLDVCRHFFEVDVVKDYIDLLAFYKMNTLHWHLTEDQGWRIAIDSFPKLTEIGAWRTEEDGSRYGGFYTKDQIREVVEYAHQRHIRIIPEIELPGHAQAALASYPQFSCAGGPIEVANDWGVFKEIYCAGNDSSFIFLKTVLTEVMELFPSPYIHIGGDEAPKFRWENCAKCQQRIADEGLHDEHELQSWFIGEMAEFLEANNRTLIGWDEILEGGLTPGAVVQSWRGTEGGIAAANAGQYAIMSPTSHCYFDYDLRAIDLEKVYSFQPVPQELEESKHHYILGGECNLWTEHIPDRKTLDRQAFPRLLAMSEVLWTAPADRDFPHFRTRVQSHYPLLRTRNVQYGAEQIPYMASTRWSGDSLWLKLESRQEGLVLKVREERDERPARYAEPRIVEPGATRVFTVQPELDGNPVGTPDEIALRTHKGLGTRVQYQNAYSSYYTAGGDAALVDGFLGSSNFRDGRWQAFSGKDAVLTIDLGSEKELRYLAVHAHQYNNAWIFLPEEVLFFAGNDTTSFTAVGSAKPVYDPMARGQFNEILGVNFDPLTARFVKVIAKNIGTVPPWHEAAGSEAWIFLDEIVIE